MTRLEVSPPHTITRRVAPARSAASTTDAARLRDRLEHAAGARRGQVGVVGGQHDAAAGLRARASTVRRVAVCAITGRRAAGAATSQPAAAAASACRRVWAERLPDTTSTGPARRPSSRQRGPVPGCGRGDARG